MNVADNYNRGFEQKKGARLGTEKNPASVVVQTEQRTKEIASLFAEGGWVCHIEVNEEKEENLSDLELLRQTPQTKVVEKVAGRNDPCPCGSGKKYKKCCG